MTQNWVSQVLSNLGSMWNVDFGTVWHRNVFMKSWYNSKSLCEYFWFFVCDFLCQTLPDQYVSIPSDQNVSILLVRIICNRNIGTFWHRKLCMKTWYSLRFLWTLPSFLVWNVGPIMSQYFQLTYCYIKKM